MQYSVGPMLEKCANYEGDDRGQGRNSDCTSKESLFHNSVGVESLYLSLAVLPWYLGLFH